MTGGAKRIIDPTILHLRAIKFITNAVVIGRGGEALFQKSSKNAESRGSLRAKPANSFSAPCFGRRRITRLLLAGSTDTTSTRPGSLVYAATADASSGECFTISLMLF
jgi:hypothetical protein